MYDPDPNKAYIKAKIAKLRHEQPEASVSTPSGSQQQDVNSQQFPSDDSVFNKDFSVLPNFVPTDTLDHLKNCGKLSAKSADDDAVTELSSSKGLRLMKFVHDLEVSKTADSEIIYLRALCWASHIKSIRYKVKMTLNTWKKPKIAFAQCDTTCPAGKIGCCYHACNGCIMEV